MIKVNAASRLLAKESTEVIAADESGVIYLLVLPSTDGKAQVGPGCLALTKKLRKAGITKCCAHVGMTDKKEPAVILSALDMDSLCKAASICSGKEVDPSVVAKCCRKLRVCQP